MIEMDLEIHRLTCRTVLYDPREPHAKSFLDDVWYGILCILKLPHFRQGMDVLKSWF